MQYNINKFIFYIPTSPKKELEDLKMIEEFGNLELKRINRIKCEFEEFNMNVKKKYQLMV